MCYTARWLDLRHGDNHTISYSGLADAAGTRKIEWHLDHAILETRCIGKCREG